MKRVVVLSAFVLVASLSAHSYRFLCNGVDADGVVEADSCGVCTDDSAARWLPGSVEILADLQTLPKGISKSGWRKTVLSGLDAWNKVPGSNLRLKYTGEATGRNFGSQASKHEIFWVTDKQEWRRKVGSGENGTLGVTMSPYHCPYPGRSNREIYDADLIMNGVKNFQWQLECQGESKCEPIGATLVHELGHFIGLGHPCVDCGWSVMSAQASSNIEKPTADDQLGLRALYPAERNGQMGSNCISNRDCDRALECISQKETKYCAQSCSNGSCPEGYSCDETSNGAFCRFSSGRLVQPARLRERCETRPCEDGLACAETFTDKSFCVKECYSKSECPKSEECVLYPDGGGGVCLQMASLNAVCGEFTTCEEKMICVGKSVSQGVCKMECDPKKPKKCPSGTECTPIGSDLGACLGASENVDLSSKLLGPVSSTLPSVSSSTQYSKGCACLCAETGASYELIGLLGIVIALFLGYRGDSASKNLKGRFEQ